ncbi:MAG: tetratricopeptide repeat protein [Candidatus Omnitrophica bacterium]|nr:tetratricopeptide repeat protein [Candidatus Omnitrophota bacterium]
MRFFFFIYACLFFAACGTCPAETLILRSGKVLEARVVEKDDQSVGVIRDGRRLYYETRLIETIDGKPPYEFSLEDLSVGEDDVSGNFEKGLLSASRGEFEAASRAFRASLNENPQDPNALEAIHIIDDLRQGGVAPEFVQALFEGTLLFLKQRYEAATKAFQRALELKPDSPELYYNVGNLYNARKLYRQAIPYFEKLLQANPLDGEALYSIGWSYFGLEEFRRAADFFERYLIVSPYDAEAHGLLGACYYALGREEEASEEFKKSQAYSDEDGSGPSSEEAAAFQDSALREEGIRRIINTF